jgi:hypothetical protein
MQTSTLRAADARTVWATAFYADLSGFDSLRRQQRIPSFGGEARGSYPREPSSILGGFTNNKIHSPTFFDKRIVDDEALGTIPGRCAPQALVVTSAGLKSRRVRFNSWEGHNTQRSATRGYTPIATG